MKKYYNIIFQLSFFTALFLLIPFILLECYLFIKSGLNEFEKYIIINFIFFIFFILYLLNLINISYILPFIISILEYTNYLIINNTAINLEYEPNLISIYSNMIEYLKLVNIVILFNFLYFYINIYISIRNRKKKLNIFIYSFFNLIVFYIFFNFTYIYILYIILNIIIYKLIKHLTRFGIIILKLKKLLIII